MAADRVRFWTMVANTAAFTLVLTVLGAVLVASPDAAEVSEAERRDLATMPALSASRVFDGSFTGGLEAFVADHFPLREGFLAASFWLKAHRGFQSDRFAYYDVEVHEGGEGLDLEEGEDPVDGELGGATAAGEGGEPEVDPAAVPDTPVPPGELFAAVEGKGGREATAPKKAAQGGGGLSSSKGVLICRGRAMEAFGGGAKGAVGWAGSVNAYQDELEGKATVYAMLVPSASGFYLPDEYRRYSRPQKTHIDATYGLLKPGVKAVDAFGEMAKHVGEHLYFRTDHHWSGRGAYYAYRAFCRAAGIEPLSLDRMEIRVQKNWLGSLYNLTRDSRLVPDDVEHFIPPVQVTTVLYPSNGKGKPRPSRLYWEGPTGYGVFLGGDYPMLVARTDVRNGRRVVVTKNSFGNAFAPLLVSHFEEVIVIDYRYFTGSLVDVIREHKVTDVIVLNNVHSANTGYHIRRVKQILHGAPPKPATKAATKPAEGTPAGTAAPSVPTKPAGTTGS